MGTEAFSRASHFTSQPLAQPVTGASLRPGFVITPFHSPSPAQRCLSPLLSITARPGQPPRLVPLTHPCFSTQSTILPGGCYGSVAPREAARPAPRAIEPFMPSTGQAVPDGWFGGRPVPVSSRHSCPVGLVSGEPPPTISCTLRVLQAWLEPLAGDHHLQQVPGKIPLHHAAR